MEQKKPYVKTMDIDDRFHYLKTILMQVKEKNGTVKYTNGNFLEDLVLLTFVVDYAISEAEYDMYFKLNKYLGYGIKSLPEVQKIIATKEWIKKTTPIMIQTLKAHPAIKQILMPYLETSFYMGRVITKDEQKFLDALR